MNNFRVSGISIYPDPNNLHYGSALAVIGGCEEILLYSMDSGSLFSKQSIRKIGNDVVSFF